MQQIPNFPLPPRLPSANAIRSCGNSPESYTPEFWEFQYYCYRYLERVSDEKLAERYKDILRNMKALISRDRDEIPIQSFLSSWYWFLKEHQTRLEFALRHTIPPILLPVDTEFNNLACGAPVRPKSPNWGDVLFRYDRREHIDSIADNGLIRIRPASDFLDMEDDRARQDEECTKKTFIPGKHALISTKDGDNIPAIGDVSQTVSMPNYYVFCMACDWDPDLFDDFGGADACLVINDTEEFARRIEYAAAQQLAGWYFYHNPIQYFDPHERVKNEFIDAAASKDFRFAYQREYRFLWLPLNGELADGFKFLSLGNLGDWAEVHGNISGNAQPDVRARGKNSP